MELKPVAMLAFGEAGAAAMNVRYRLELNQNPEYLHDSLYDRSHIDRLAADCGPLVNIGPKVHILVDHDDDAIAGPYLQCVRGREIASARLPELRARQRATGQNQSAELLVRDSLATLLPRSQMLHRSTWR